MMREYKATVSRLLALSASDWRFLCAASVLELTVFAAMRVLPLQAIRRIVTTPGPLVRMTVGVAFGHQDEKRTLWAIDTAGRRLGQAGSCLIRAIVGALALGSERRVLRICIGVRHGEAGTLESHAWLCDGTRVLVGGADSPDRFAPMVAWQAVSS